jgi:integrase
MVIRVLQPLWTTKSETAHRVRGRIEAVLDWARVRGYRDGENPARWKGHLDHLLPARGKVHKVRHHSALPYTALADFMRDLRVRKAVAARALEFAILTATRTSETLNAAWSELDLANRLWTIPEGRMKGGRKHKVPLCDRTIAIIEEMKEEKKMHPMAHSQFVFPGMKPGKALSNMAMLILLRRMGRGDLTAHGFRSTFRTWAAERTDVPREVVEAALAHVIGDKVEAAYQRGDLIDKRTRLMNAWGEFCTNAQGSADVIPMRR